VWAGRSLPHVGATQLSAVLDKAAAALRPGGYFVADFFGPRHAFAGRPDLVCLDEAQIRDTLPASLEVIELRGDGALLELIARKRVEPPPARHTELTVPAAPVDAGLADPQAWQRAVARFAVMREHPVPLSRETRPQIFAGLPERFSWGDVATLARAYFGATTQRQVVRPDDPIAAWAHEAHFLLGMPSLEDSLGSLPVNALTLQLPTFAQRHDLDRLLPASRQLYEEGLFARNAEVDRIRSKLTLLARRGADAPDDFVAARLAEIRDLASSNGLLHFRSDARSFDALIAAARTTRDDASRHAALEDLYAWVVSRHEAAFAPSPSQVREGYVRAIALMDYLADRGFYESPPARRFGTVIDRSEYAVYLDRVDTTFPSADAVRDAMHRHGFPAAD
jgi:hypothetical protein